MNDEEELPITSSLTHSQDREIQESLMMGIPGVFSVVVPTEKIILKEFDDDTPERES